ncbi:hypothetical protein [Microtetraspora niveoalba]|uniref:hypothetical protein n=1 Tax=Microtetraspora niveoalba TaxID=46175 RepID=UPI0012F83EED|nr:hypothetical protein [Microtetraspora niveoalba]
MRSLYAAVVAVSVLTVAACGGEDGGAGGGAAAEGDQRAAYLNCLRENGVTLPSGRPRGRPSRAPDGEAGGAAGEAAGGRGDDTDASGPAGTSGASDGQGDGGASDGRGDAPGDASSDAPSARPSRGPGGFRSMSPEMRKAMEACRSLMPEGGRGWGGNGRGPGDGTRDSAAVEAAMRPFRTCMKDNGAEIAEGGSWRDLDQKDTKVAAALTKCRTLLPEPSPRPS